MSRNFEVPLEVRGARAIVRLGIVAGLALPISAMALVGGAGVAPNTADSPWAGVGSLSVGGSKFTATLIAPGYVLTAAHVAKGADPSTVTFQVNAGNSFAIAASEIFVNPNYAASSAGNQIGDPTNHADLAIIKLAVPVPADIPFYDLFEGNLQKKDLTFVSFAGSLTSKITGENRVDQQFSDASGVKQVYLFDFDGPDLASNQLGMDILINGTLGANREASLVGGDSGSAAFVQVNGKWQLAGVNTFEIFYGRGPSVSGEFGTGGGGIVLFAHAPWIQSVVLASVPEPAPWLTFLLGIPLMVGFLKRH